MPFNTRNPIPSGDLRDLDDNARNIDVWANDKTKLSHPDRFGVERYTWHGLEQKAQLDLADAVAEATSVSEQARDQAIDAKNAAQEAAMMSGFSKYADTLAQLEAGIGTDYLEGDVVMVFQDESRGDTSSIFKIESGAAEFKLTFDKTRQDLLSFTGNISADAEWSDVPAHSDPAFDVQVHALVNRVEWLNTYKTDAGIDRTPKARLRDYATLKDFGAVGDGVFHPLSDEFSSLSAAQQYYPFVTSLDVGIDWAAAQLAANSTKRTIRVCDGDFVIDRKISSAMPGRWWEGAGGVLIAHTPEITILSLDAANQRTEDLLIDGNLKAAIAIDTGYGGNVIRGGEIFGIKTLMNFACAIRAVTNQGVDIAGVYIHDLFSESNTSAGAGGIVRAVQIYSNQAAVRRSTIKDLIVRDVQGFEGDSIHVMFQNAGNYPFLDGLTSVKNCVIENFSRRGIKIQANKCRASDNEVYNFYKTEDGFPNINSGINIIAGSENIIDANEVSTSVGTPIAVQGVDASTGCRANVIRGNYVDSDSVAHGIYHEYCDDIVIDQNYIFGGSGNAISGGASSRPIARGNVAFGGSGGSSVFTTATASNAVASGNIQLGGTRAQAVRLAAPNSIATGNINLGEGHCITAPATATGLVAADNIASDATKTTIDSAVSTGLRARNNTHVGAATSTYGSEYWFYKAPDATSHPNTYFTRGDVIHNTNPSGAAAGWICSTEGLGGVAVFKTLPTS